MSDSTERITSANQEVRLAKSSDDIQLERLRRKRKGIIDKSERRKDLEVPGYDGELWVSFKVIDWADIKRLGQRGEHEPERYRELMMQMDILIASCDCLKVLKSDGRLHPLMGEQIGFDQRLVELLELRDATGAPPKSARDIVRALFNGNDLGISQMHNELMAWMPRAEQKIDEESLGN